MKRDAGLISWKWQNDRQLAFADCSQGRWSTSQQGQKKMEITASFDTSILSYQPDNPQFEEDLLVSHNYGIGQVLIAFEFNLPNNTILDGAWLNLALGGKVGHPAPRCQACSDFSTDETWDSYQNSILQNCYGLEKVGMIVPGNVAFIDVKSIVQNWIMFPNQKRNLCVYLDEGDPNARLEYQSSQTSLPPHLHLDIA